MLTQDDLNKIGGLIEDKLDSGLKPIKKDLKKIAKKLDDVIDHFDGRTTKLEIKAAKIEDHLNLSSKN